MSTWNPPLWYDRLAGIAWRAVIVVIGLAMLVAGFIALSAVILPLFLGLLFTCALHPVTAWLRRLGASNAIAAIGAVAILVVAIVAVAILTINAVVDQWSEIDSLITAGRATIVDSATDNGVDPSTASTIEDDVGDIVGSITEVLLGGLVRLIPTVAGIVTSVLLSFLVAFFFLKDGPAMWDWIVERVGTARALTERVGGRVWTALTGFMLGQTVIAAVDATCITLGALVLGVPEAAAIFMLTFFGAFIPFIGAFLSGLVAVLLATGDSGLSTGVAMLAVVLAVQVLEGNVLQPWIQGRAVRLHPLVIALAVTAGGALAGFLGVFLAVPVTAAAFVALAELRAAGIIGPARPEA